MYLRFEYRFDCDNEVMVSRVCAKLIDALFNYFGERKFSPEEQDGVIKLALNDCWPLETTIVVGNGSVVGDLKLTGRFNPTEAFIRRTVDQHAREIGLRPAMPGAVVGAA